MKNKIKIIGIVAFLAGSLFACKEEFLDRPAQGNLDGNTLNNEAGVQGSLISSYSMLDGWGNYGAWGAGTSNWIFGSVASDDAYKGSEPGDQQAASDAEFYQWSTGAVDGYINSKWEVTYDGINRANSAINLGRQVVESGGMTQADLDVVEGEALGLRAFYHFEAYKMWENIPYYTELDEDFRKTNVGSDAIASILADLDAAIAKLPESQGSVGRLNKWSAKALKGKALMYKGDYAAARTVLEDVVENGPFELEANFHEVFKQQNNNGKETVIAYQASVNDGNPSGQNGNRADRLNFPHGGSEPHFGCCGFHQPSQNLVNAFKVDANGLPFLDGGWNNTDLAAADPVDPRIDWTVGRDDIPYLDWDLHAPGWIRDRPWAGPYSPKKNIPEKAADARSAVGWASYQLTSLNLHLLRFADVMLLYAEAEILAGDPAIAREMINEIRARAAVAAQGPVDNIIVPIDDPSTTWANYQIGEYPAAGWTADYAMKALKYERRVELAMEGHRLFDLRRWGEAKDVLNAYVEKEKTRRNYLTAAKPFEDRHNLYPLPTRQIELSRVVDDTGNVEDRLVQNTGW